MPVDGCHDGCQVSGTAEQEERLKWAANERADALAEAMRPLLSWAEAMRQHYAMIRTEPPFTSTVKLTAALDSAYRAFRLVGVDEDSPS